MYEAKLEFLGGREDTKQKNFHGGEYGYFLELYIKNNATNLKSAKLLK